MKKQNRALSVILSTVIAVSAAVVMPLTVSAEDTPFVPSVNPPAVAEYTDNFDGDAISDKWTVCYTPTTEEHEKLQVADGKFGAVAGNWNTFKKLKLYTGDAAWMDYAVEAELCVAKESESARDPRMIGVIVRANDIGTGDWYDMKGYFIAIDTDKRSYVIDGANQKYAELPIMIDVYALSGEYLATPNATFTVDGKHFAMNTSYELKVLVCGNTMRIYLDDVFAGEFTDDTYKSGYVGINQYMAGFYSDSFSVRALTDAEKTECETGKDVQSSDDTVIVAPSTFDPIVVALALASASGAAFVVSAKKR